ncbi:MAG: CotH kinase family protein, partial [Pirellulales bacterium]|nr:CotH kinase family protein [Pirellulales bacterium]
MIRKRARSISKKRRALYSRGRAALQVEPLEPRIVLAAMPFISEFVASNDSTLADGNGNFSDWIEIYNPTDQAVDLDGWHLTDNRDALDQWTFPAILLDPGEYLVVFASNQDVDNYIDPLGYLHTNFNINAEGEYLALTDPNETIVHEYAPEYPYQITDVSYGAAENIAQIPLIGASESATAWVPTDGLLDPSNPDDPPPWTLIGFDDSPWLASGGGVGVGFDSGDDPIPDIPNGTLLPNGLLGYDLTDPEEDGILNGTITAGGFPGSPSNEEPPMALDNTVGTKWLAFEPSGTYYQFQFSGGQQYAVNGYTITSANDYDNRDPYSWTLSGSNNGFDFTVVDTRTAQNFANRFETRLYEFNNNTAYAYYKFDFLTEYGATGSNQPNSIQMAEIELLSYGPINYDPLIDLDIETQWAAAQTSVYERIEFDVADPAIFSSLILRMQYDDGFVTYLNGQQIASANAPGTLHYNSNATAEQDDNDALIQEIFQVTEYLDLLVTGTNVLAIHGLNVSDTNPDMLIRPELVAMELIDETLIESYYLFPTPGSANNIDSVTLGPIIQNVTENPDQPLPNSDLVITAEVHQTRAPIDDVTLVYRVMFNDEVPIGMNDSGTGFDAMAGDGVYSAAIPISAGMAGQMVRWYVTATDIQQEDSRYPLFVHPTNSPEYFGTVVLDASVTSALPIFEYFVQNVAAAGTQTGTRASVFFLGEFYDNVFIRHRGGYTTQGRKFEFNDGHHFRFDPDLGRVDEINLNERGWDSTYLRQVLAWDVYALAGQPASLAAAWHTRRNDQFLAVRIFVEQPDSDLLRRTSLDPDGAFYKIGADGIENSVTSSTVGVVKRTRDEEDHSDLQALVDGVNPYNPYRDEYVFDNVDIASVINYIAATAIMHDNDHPHKNFHLYRDTEGSGQWMFLPWDKDLTFGLNNGLSGIIGNQDPYSHPFFGDYEHQKVDHQWNRLIDAVFEVPSIREMYVRRLRTLMDQFLSPPGTPAGQSWLEMRVAELVADLQNEPGLGGSSWLAEVAKITGEYLTERRGHLYINHIATNTSYPDNAGIPAAQVGNPAIQFGVIEFNPSSGNQD